jgi:hypothetical protein
VRRFPGTRTLPGQPASRGTRSLSSSTDARLRSLTLARCDQTLTRTQAASATDLSHLPGGRGVTPHISSDAYSPPAPDLLCYKRVFHIRWSQWWMLEARRTGGLTWVSAS